MELREMKECDFATWFGDPHFASLTFKSHIIQLPETVREWLRKGDFILSEGHFPVTRKKDEYDSDDWETEEGSEKAESYMKGDDWDLLRSEISEVIERFDGEVFPKLNWSSPKDASWMSINGSLKCQTPDDIFVLLKSSDNVQLDLQHAYDLCSDNHDEESPDTYLVLRKWYDLNSKSEYRCFVADRQVVGISSRHPQPDAHIGVARVQQLKTSLVNFVCDQVLEQFPLESFTCDLYISRSGSIWIVDFNPFSLLTDSLLFSWEELGELRQQKRNGEEVEPELRLEGAMHQVEMQSGPIEAVSLEALIEAQRSQHAE